MILMAIATGKTILLKTLKKMLLSGIGLIVNSNVYLMAVLESPLYYDKDLGCLVPKIRYIFLSDRV
ncbi:hypothetical protein [Lysinibacillus sp. NPDC092081]|uniref:hypothetical protein n=1 Tax=Lysinibacillus sp. NPDC092081 TaxID=3364131 RepID=UPI0038280973